MLDTESIKRSLIETNAEVNTLNRVNFYTTLVLVLLGCSGNLISLKVFVNAKHKLPKVNGSSYLIALTVSNTLYLLFHSYMAVLNQLILELNLQGTDHFLTKISAFDTNVHVCRFVGFFKHLLLLLNTFIVLAFSVKRFIAIYFPLRMLDYKFTNFFGIQMLALFSFVCSLYIPIYTELVPTTLGLPKNKHISDEVVKLNITPNFNSLALRSTYNEKFCSFSDKHIHNLLKFHSINMIVLILSYLLISASIILIVVKMRRKQKKFMIVFRATPSIKNGSNLDEDESEASTKLNNHDCINNNNSKRSTHNSTSISLKSVTFQQNGAKKNAVKVRSTNRKKFRNSRMLIWIAVSFVLLNFPYYCIMAASVFFVKQSVPSDDMLELASFKIKRFLVMAEMLQISNYSITSLIFFVSGKIFRLHLFKIFK
jgi:hypothetical protein